MYVHVEISGQTFLLSNGIEVVFLLNDYPQKKLLQAYDIFSSQVDKLHIKKAFFAYSKIKLNALGTQVAS